MEKEFNRNGRSYRPRRDDSRDDYQSGRDDNRYSRPQAERFGDRANGARRERGFSNGPRAPRPFDGGERRERTFNGNGERRERPYGAPGADRRPRFRNDDRREFMPHERPGISSDEREEMRRKHYSKRKLVAHRLKNEDENTELRLNRYIAMSGVCSRRDADDLIVAGRVKVNGEVVQVVGQKVKRSDSVEVDGNLIIPERKVYLVLNKPKDYVTTVEDPLERKTVMSLLEGACKERVYPVGRLDRQTTGVLLFTNDGDLAKKLTHPKYDHKKIYHVFLDKPLEEADFNAIAEGIELEDGFIKADEISYTSPDRTEVGIEIHSGKNRIVRRIFEHFGYRILKLDRVYFAGITKKNIPRGKWRFLTSREVNMLKVY